MKKILFSATNSKLEALFGIKIVKTGGEVKSSPRVERDYWYRVLCDFYRNNYNLEILPIQEDNSIVPPIELLKKVQFSRHSDPDYFFSEGYKDSYDILTLFEKHGVQLNNVKSVLEFGVGFSRILINWFPFNDAKLYGCDITPEGLQWSKQLHGSRVNYELTNPEPPLPYDDDFFDVIYSNAVFIHIPYKKQEVWIKELLRILKSGGFIVVTYYEPSVNLTQFSASEVHEKLIKTGWYETPGSSNVNYNATTTHISRDLLLKLWGEYFTVLDFVPRFKKHSMLIVKKTYS